MASDDRPELVHIAPARASSEALDSDLRWIEQARVVWDGETPRVGIFFVEKRSLLIAWLIGALLASGLVAAGVYALDLSGERGEITSKKGR